MRNKEFIIIRLLAPSQGFREKGRGKKIDYFSIKIYLNFSFASGLLYIVKNFSI
jgi:hypothetical protein